MIAFGIQVVLVAGLLLAASGTAQGPAPATDTAAVDILGGPAGDALRQRGAELLDVRSKLEQELADFKRDCTGAPIERAPECDARQLELNGRVRAYVDAVARHQQDVARAIDLELAALGERIARTRASIEAAATRLRGYPAALDEWTRVPLEARKAARHAALEAVAGVSLELLGAQTAGQLARAESDLAAASRALAGFAGTAEGARLLQAIDALRTDADLTRLLTLLHDPVGAVPAGASREEWLTACLRVIGVINTLTLRQPAIALLIADGELLVADVYAGVAGKLATDRVRELCACTEAELRGLQSLTELHERDVDQRRRLEAARSKLRPAVPASNP